MTELKFTKGPWRATIGDHGICNGMRGYVAIDDGSRSIAAIWLSDEHGNDISEHDANAHLIAAAPELYEEGEESERTLRAVVDALKDLGKIKLAIQVCEQANRQSAALRKARGEA